MTQYVINIGAIPNDGTGDPLRTAFNETNLNFDQVFAAGPVLSNIQIANNTIMTTNVNGNLVLAPNGTAVVQSNVSIVPNTANIRNLGSSTRRWATVYAQYLNATQINLTGDCTVNGNLTVQGNIIQVGNIVTETLTIQLANAASTANAANGSGITVGANDNIATLLYNSTGNVWTTNIGVSSVGNITAPYFFGNGSLLTGVTSSYGNSNVSTLLAGFGSNTVSTTGNISGGYLFGNGSQLTGLPAGYANANAVAYGESGWAGNIIPSGNAVYSLGNATNQWNDLYVSNATIFMNNVPVSLSAGNVLTVNGNAVLTNGSNTAVSTTGNITAGNIGITGGSLTWANASIVQTSASDVSITGDGQVTVRSLDGTYQWTFESNGNLTLPGNVSATGNVTGNYFFGNGSQLTGISANTGNVTFSGEAVIGTGTSNTVSGLYLAPDPVSLANDLYLRVRGNILDEPTHIHFDTGNNQYYNLIIGDDNKYIQLANTGNIVINTNDYAGNTAQWMFDTDGSLTLPGANVDYTIATQGGYITVGNLLIGQGGALFNSNNDSWALYGNISDPGATIFIPSNADAGNGTALYIESQQSNVEIRSGSGTWNFGNTSNLTLPLGGVVSEGASPTGLGNTIALTPAGGSDADQQLLVYPTGNVVEGNHLHLTTGNLYNTELYLGNDNLYVKLANTGNVVINSYDGVGNAGQWTFGTNESLTLPGGSRLRPLGANLDIFAGTGSYVNLITTDESTSVGVDGGGGYITTAGGTWDFDTTGNLTVPGNIIMTTGIVGSGASPAPYLSGFSSVSAINISASGNVTAANFLMCLHSPACHFDAGQVQVHDPRSLVTV
jgi:hypothetical protein